MDLERLTDEEYYAHLKEMFLSPGWVILMAELKGNALHINSVEDTNTENELFFRKGQMAVLANILNMETSIEMAEKEAKNEDSE